MEYKTYIIVFYNPNMNIDLLNRWISHSPYVLTYWNYIPLVYCIKSKASVDELRVHFEPILGLQNFVIAEINPSNMTGRLPPEAWPWFYTPVPPQPPIQPNAQVPPHNKSFLGLLAGSHDKKP